MNIRPYIVLNDVSSQTVQGLIISSLPAIAKPKIRTMIEEIDGRDGSFYLGAVVPVQPVSGIGETPQWIAPEGNAWESLPDSLSAISVKASMPYKAEVYIFDGISVFVNHMEQKFGYDGEMDNPLRDNEDGSNLGFLYWDQRSNKGRKVGTGIYIWKIIFTFEDGYKETVIIKTGIKR